MPALFDFVNSINDTKEDLSEKDTFNSDYNSFMINRALAQSQDNLYIANEMNKLYYLPKEMQYKFLLNIVIKKKRYAKWSKKSVDKDILNVSQYYKVSIEKAQDYLKILSDEQLREIENILNFDPMKKPK